MLYRPKLRYLTYKNIHRQLPKHHHNQKFLLVFLMLAFDLQIVTIINIIVNFNVPSEHINIYWKANLINSTCFSTHTAVVTQPVLSEDSGIQKVKMLNHNPFSIILVPIS